MQQWLDKHITRVFNSMDNARNYFLTINRDFDILVINTALACALLIGLYMLMEAI